MPYISSSSVAPAYSLSSLAVFLALPCLKMLMLLFQTVLSSHLKYSLSKLSLSHRFMHIHILMTANYNSSPCLFSKHLAYTSTFILNISQSSPEDILKSTKQKKSTCFQFCYFSKLKTQQLTLISPSIPHVRFS